MKRVVLFLILVVMCVTLFTASQQKAKADWLWEEIGSPYADPWFKLPGSYWWGNGTFHNNISGCTPTRGKLAYIDTMTNPMEYVYKGPMWDGEIPFSEIKPNPKRMKIRVTLVGAYHWNNFYTGLAYAEVQWKDSSQNQMFTNRIPVQAGNAQCQRYVYEGDWVVPSGARYYRLALVKTADSRGTIIDRFQSFWTYGLE